MRKGKIAYFSIRRAERKRKMLSQSIGASRDQTRFYLPGDAGI